MKVIIAGSRSITDAVLLAEAIRQSGFHITEVVSGGARGVDRLGEVWAQGRGILLTQCLADWHQEGRRAGFLRNSKMAAYAEALIALWDGTSTGTRDMIAEARKRGLLVYVKEVVP